MHAQRHLRPAADPADIPRLPDAPGLQIAAWIVLLGIGLVTLVPLRSRPTLSIDPQTERFLAYMALGFAFALAYPRRRVVVAVSMVACALGLEAAQHLTRDRHSHLRDALAKALGGLVGVLAVDVSQRYATPRGVRRRAF